MNASLDETLAETIVSFVAGLNEKDVPDPVRHECKRALVDSVGCIVGGGQHTIVSRATETLAGFFGPSQASLFGRGMQADVLHAALINGTAGASYSFFDNYSPAHLHAGASHAAALLAVAEWKRASGADFLSSYIAGMEVACRLTKAIALPPADMDVGWSTGGVVNGISCAVAAGKLLGLDRERLTWAIGIAASQAAGMRVEHGTMTGSLIYGQAAQVGVRAAILAADGFTSSKKSLNGRFGYAQLFSREAHLASLIEDLNGTWEVSQLNYKPFPTDIAIHAGIEAMLWLKREYGFAGTDVARIHADASELATSFGDRPRPANNLEAKFSLQHWFSAVAVYGEAGIEQGKDVVVHDPEIRRLSEATQLTTNPDFKWDAVAMVVELKDGRRLEKRIEHCIGSPEVPMSDTDIDEKFVAQATACIGQERATELSRLCWNVETLPDVSVLAAKAC